MLLWKLHTTCRRQSDFDPRTLFTQGVDGFYIDASSLAEQYALDGDSMAVHHLIDAQDPSGFSEPVDYLYDLSLNRHRLFTGQGHYMPVLRSFVAHNTTFFYWDFFGTFPRFLVGQAWGNHGALTTSRYDIICAIRTEPSGFVSSSPRYQGLLSLPGDSCSFFMEGSTRTIGTWGSGWYPADRLLTTEYETTPTELVLSMVGGASGSFRINGEAAGTYARTTGQPMQTATIGGLSEHNQGADMKLFAMLAINRRLTHSEIRSTEHYFAYLMNTLLPA